MRTSVTYLKGTIPIEGYALIGTFFVLFLINLQLWDIDAAPLIDWPNHLARHILQCGALGAEAIGKYYEYNLEFVPNLSSDLIHTLDIACINPEITQKILIQASSIGLVFSTLILHRSIWGSFSVWPLISALIMHHMAWAYGFENFVLAIPVALLILAFWFAAANWQPVVRLLPLWPMAAGLYALHLYAFGFLFLVVTSLEIERLWSNRLSKDARRSAILTTSLLILIAAFPAFQTIVSIQASPELETAQWRHGGISTLAKTLLSPFLGFSDQMRSMQANYSAIATMLSFVLIFLGLCRYSKAVVIDARVRRILPVLLFAALVAPHNFSSIFFSNIRFPIMVLALFIAATRFEMPTRVVWAFSSAVLTVVAVKTGWIASNWRLHDKQVTELRQAATFLKPTDRLLVLRKPRNASVVLHSHSASYLLRDQGAFWIGMFTGGNSLSPKPEYAHRDHTQLFPMDWHFLKQDYSDLPQSAEGGVLHKWSSFYTHALLLFDHRNDRPDASIVGEVLSMGSFFTFYEISPAAMEDWP